MESEQGVCHFFCIYHTNLTDPGRATSAEREKTQGHQLYASLPSVPQVCPLKINRGTIISLFQSHCDDGDLVEISLQLDDIVHIEENPY